MKIALLGYGKMGHEVEKLAVSRGHTIQLILDNENDWTEKGSQLNSCDVAIEFSMPATAITNMSRCFVAGVPVVVGTTGWYTHFAEVSELCSKKDGTLFHTSNFSIGVNVFSEINRKLASLLEKYLMYQPAMTEIHHTQKLDAPSGTAITLAEGIISANANYHGYSETITEEGLIPVTSIREGNVTGTHTITWTSEVDRITITHEAFNRQGLASGAMMAAEWVCERKGVFTMRDMLSL